MSEIANRIRSTVDEDGAAILDIERNQIITLNATGGFVWERLKQGEPVERIIQELAQVAGTDAPVVDEDVRVFIDQLTEMRLLDS
jgi:Coenzyme PQQ synthesis protein D (PqqD)